MSEPRKNRKRKQKNVVNVPPEIQAHAARRAFLMALRGEEEEDDGIVMADKRTARAIKKNRKTSSTVAPAGRLENNNNSRCASGQYCSLPGVPFQSSPHKCATCKKKIHSSLCSTHFEENGRMWCRICRPPKPNNSSTSTVENEKTPTSGSQKRPSVGTAKRSKQVTPVSGDMNKRKIPRLQSQKQPTVHALQSHRKERIRVSNIVSPPAARSPLTADSATTPRNIARTEFPNEKTSRVPAGHSGNNHNSRCASGQYCALPGVPFQSSPHKCATCKKKIHSSLCSTHFEENGKMWCRICRPPKPNYSATNNTITPHRRQESVPTQIVTQTVKQRNQQREEMAQRREESERLREENAQTNASLQPSNGRRGRPKKRKKTLEERYYHTLRRFMSFRDNVRYTDEKMFTAEELVQIQPEDIDRWFCKLVYGKTNPGPEDYPVFGRSNTLKCYKKQLSKHMPHQMIQWNIMAGFGNPTRSVLINERIKAVIKAETRRQGKPSQARRQFDHEEYCQVMNYIHEECDSYTRSFVSAIFRFQFHFIGRVDDTTKVLKENLFPTPDPEHQHFCICTRLCWSKNVHEERDAPLQLLIGAQHPLYCVLVGLSLFLEECLSRNHHLESRFLFAIDGLDNEDNIKKRASSFIDSCLKKPSFKISLDGPKGTHSLRKYATNLARSKRCSKDEIDHRARWKASKRQQDIYCDTTIPTVDAKVGAALCVGGPIFYSVKKGSNITEEWIFSHVVPHTFRVYGPSIASVLGRALLWCIMDPEQSAIVCEVLRKRVCDAYEIVAARSSLDDGENPIMKVPLHITIDEGKLEMEQGMTDDELVRWNEQADEIIGQNPSSEQSQTPINNDVPMAIQRRRLENAHLMRLTAQVVSLQRELRETRMEISHSRELSTQQFRIVKRNLNTLMRNPTRNFSGGRRRLYPPPNIEVEHLIAEDSERQANITATLGKCPRTLSVLWHEWEFGLAGRKPARLFSPKERGRKEVKHNYSKRRPFWRLASELIRRGHTAPSACNLIQQAYGPSKPVSAILTEVRKDKGMRLLR